MVTVLIKVPIKNAECTKALCQYNGNNQINQCFGNGFIPVIPEQSQRISKNQAGTGKPPDIKINAQNPYDIGCKQIFFTETQHNKGIEQLKQQMAAKENIQC